MASIRLGVITASNYSVIINRPNYFVASIDLWLHGPYYVCTYACMYVCMNLVIKMVIVSLDD